jgi:GT2 family glycosyltransferase
VFRTDVVRNVGGFRPGFDGSQDYDLILRVTEVARTIVHIPKVLYHWRAIPGSTASSTSEKPQAYVAAHRALQDHLDRLGIDGRVEDAGFGYHKIVRHIKSEPSVSIIIPTCGSEKVIFGHRTVLVLNLLESLRRRTDYSNLDVIVVADTHTPVSVMEGLTTFEDLEVTVVDYGKSFNFSDKCNIGFSHARGDLVLLLNDDIEIIDDDWLSTLVPYAQEEDIGLVGPLLLLEDGRIQSAGHSNTPSPHNFRNGHLAQSPGEFGVLAIARECSGVTGAAALLRREVYREVGGLSVQFPHCFNDVDFAFKILEAGYRIIWTPHARLYHFESVSRDPVVNKAELDLLMNRWGRYFDNDRFCRLN